MARAMTIEQAATGQLGRGVRATMKAVMREAHEQSHNFVRETARQLTPTDHTPEMINRWHEEKPRNGTSFIGNSDPGGGSVDFGRRRNHYKGYSRMGGSAQAPRGISKPTYERLAASFRKILAAAYARGEQEAARR